MTTEIINDKEITIYTWPNPCFPFRLYFNSDKCRIFIIENISHNFNWLKECKNKIKDSDYFFSITGWYASEHVTNLSKKIIEYLGLNPNQFIVLCNDHKELKRYMSCGFNNSMVLNQNAFLDENLYGVLSENRIYDAILISRATVFKRIGLAKKVKNLALVTGNVNFGTGMSPVDIPPHVNNDDRRLTPLEIVKIINQSKCGLCLSEMEGACFSSSEYLLCGIPVVSTPSLGGRDLWYDEDNSIMCDPNIDSVKQSVEKIISKRTNALKIRNNHIELSKFFRRTFVDKVEQIFKKHSVQNMDAQKYFEENFFNKMRKSLHYNSVVSYFQ